MSLGKTTLLAAVLPALAAGQYCPSLHADFMRLQLSQFNLSTPSNATKGNKHVPFITISGTEATVTVGDGNPYHPMTPSTDPNVVHFVTDIYVMDHDGGFVAHQTLDATVVVPAKITFQVPPGAKNLTAYEWCNKHGLWVGPTVSLSPPAAETAGTCAVDHPDAPSYPSFHADFMRRQDREFKSPIPFNESTATDNKHVPYITLNGSTGKVIVGDGQLANGIYHPMVASSNSATVHWVTAIWVVDESSAIVTMQNLDPTTVTKAEITFTLPTSFSTLTAYEWCNKHGLWVGPTVSAPTTTTTPTQASGAVRVALAAAAALGCAFLMV